MVSSCCLLAKIDLDADSHILNSKIAKQTGRVDAAASLSGDSLADLVLQLHLKNEGHDATIRVGDTKFEVCAGNRSGHCSNMGTCRCTNVMVCQSKYFKRLLGDENKKEIVIEEIEAPIVQTIIDFAYRDAAAVYLAAHALKLYDAAHKLGIEALRVSRFSRSLPLHDK